VPSRDFSVPSKMLTESGVVRSSRQLVSSAWKEAVVERLNSGSAVSPTNGDSTGGWSRNVTLALLETA
jgi:hypothetical protein